MATPAPDVAPKRGQSSPPSPLAPPPPPIPIYDPTEVCQDHLNPRPHPHLSLSP